MNTILESTPTQRPFTHDQISERAQALWSERGRPDGQDEVIWLEAERQLAHELEAVAEAEAALTETSAPAAADVRTDTARVHTASPAASAPLKPASKSGGKKRSGKGR